MTFYQYQTGEVYDCSFEPSSDDAVKLSNKAGKVARQKYGRREAVKPH